MRKAVAIPYVIALILGLIAIVILAYWFIGQSGKTTNVGAGASCQGKLFSFCNQWLINGGKVDDKPKSFDWDTCTDKTKDLTAECKNIGIGVGQ